MSHASKKGFPLWRKTRMMRISAVSLATLVFVLSLNAQSGRKIEPTPTPVAQTQDNPLTYSESTPLPKRPPRVWPSLRGSTTPRTQDQPATSVSKTNQETPPVDIADTEGVVKVETNLVTIPVSVFDRHGLYIPNLTKNDFKIFEDGREQQIEYFGTSEQPFTVVLLLDTSPSTEYEIDEIRDAARAFVDQLKPQDKVMVIEFDGNVHVLAEPTGDRPTIYKAIKKADFGGGTALYDAVNFSLAQRLNNISGRKAIVLFTDGVDTQSSKSNYDSTISLAEEADSLIFPIYYNTYDKVQDDNSGLWGPPAPGTTAREYAVGKKYLEELAAYTGGRIFRPEDTPGGLKAAFEGIAEELRKQYNIGYIPSEEGKPGERRRIKVRVNRPNLVLRARDSYIVGTR